MRPNRPSRRSGSFSFSRLFGAGRNRLSKAPRRRDVERLEERQLLTTTPFSNEYFEDQWYLLASGQNTEFNQQSPTFDQTLAVEGQDLNVIGAWSQGVDGTGVQIAILSGGFDLTHEDLVFTNAAVPTNSDQLSGDDDPAADDLVDSIGTALAGIVGAQDNNVGIVGVAHGADLFPIRLSAGPNELLSPTIDAVNRAYRYQAGFVQDGNGDGVPDTILGGALVPIDIDGDGVADGLGQDPSLVTDIFLHGSDYIESLEGVSSRVAVDLPSGPSTEDGTVQISILDAIVDTAIGGRAVWIDDPARGGDGDGLLDQNEIHSLGSIHIVPSGDNAGSFRGDPARSPGDLSSSQYNRLANSPYTIAVGAVDYDGQYRNPATGLVSGTAEAGANLLVVAHAGTITQDIGTNLDLNSGVVTTDPTGATGANIPGLPNFEFDGDYFADTDYSSSLAGTDAAAAQVAGVVGLMLEANPLLTYRDVQQILLMSARTNDQFSETWIVNQVQEFRDNYVIPQYQYHQIDLDGEPGAELEDVIIPNTGIDPMTGEPFVTRGVFLNDPDMDLGLSFTYDPADPFATPDLVDVTTAQTGDMPPASPTVISPTDRQPEVLFYTPGLGDRNLTPGLFFLQFPTNAVDPISPFFADARVPLEFENGAGFTVSHGYGSNLEELGYGHGLVDAALAVELATAWETNDLYLDDAIVITTGSTPAPNPAFRLQPAATITDDDGNVVLSVPGGVDEIDNINAAFYEQFLVPISTEEVTDINDTVIGEVITGAPFYDPEGNLDLDGSDRGFTRIPISFDPSVEDFASVEWIELTTQIDSGDVDQLRLALLSPDGTQSELNLARRPGDGNGDTAFVPQSPQGQQGRITPSEEAIKDGGFGAVSFNDDVITGNEQIFFDVVETADAVTAGDSWTWTTNRHWGELFSFQANSGEGVPGGSDAAEDEWFLIVENRGASVVTFGQNFEVTVHGTKATGNRIQGKIGVDDNLQGIEDIDGDGHFNFNRYVELAQIQVDILDATGNIQTIDQTVVLDDANDSVTYGFETAGGQVIPMYKAADPDTGVEVFYPVVPRQDYFDLNIAGMLPALESYYRERIDPTIAVTGVPFYTTSVQRALGQAELADPLSFRNFDYAQESFGAGVTVTATPTQHTWELSSTSGLLEIVDSQVVTSGVQRFTTGHDGNYYFDVDATPRPPELANFSSPLEYEVAANEWLRLFGTTFSYSLTLDAQSTSRVKAANTAHGGFFDVPDGQLGDANVAYQFVTTGAGAQAAVAQAEYTVDIFSRAEIDLSGTSGGSATAFGRTSKVENLNFLLEVDPALTNVDVSGTIYRDRNGDGVQQVGIEESIGGAVVFYDANGDGLRSAGEVSAVTDANGAYSFTIGGLSSSQTVQLRVEATSTPANLEFLSPATGTRSVDVTPGTPSGGIDFTLRRIGGELAQVTGVVFEDVNQNGVQDGSEAGVDSSKQVRVYIDLNGNDQYDPGGATPDPAAFTQSDGSYVIETDATGTFEVRVDDAATPLTQTSPAGGAGIEVNFAQGVTTSAVNFGVFDGRNQDFGDLFGYATLLSENGPRHVVLPNVRLGSSVDVDSDGFGDPLLTSSPDSFGDDFDATDDEDGVALVGTITEGSTFTFDVEAYGNGFVLNAWIDYDNDGEFEASEQIFTNLEDIQADSANPAPIPMVTAPTGADFDSTTQFFAARFRWGPSGLGPTGAANAGEVEDYLLATTPPIAVTGQVRIDADGDSAFDGTDTAVAGATVYFDQNLNGLLDPEERRGVTDANGFYQILIDSTQSIDVTIRVDETSLDPTLESLVPVDGVFSQTVSVSQPVTANFLYGFPQGVSGVVFNDANNNGIRDGEPGFAGLTVNVFSDPDLDGVFDTLVGSAVTAADGSYTVPVPVVGSYDVALDLSSLEFVTQTTPAGSAQRVTVNVGAIAAGVDFGAFDAVPTFTQDYGDLIVDGSRNYPTTLADNGARHTIVPGVFLGDVPPDADPGTRESSDAQADDLLFGDDEDAVNVLTPTIQPSSTLTFEAKVNGSGAVLNAWVDFNNDGDWDDAGEQILTDRGATSGIITTFIVNTPADVDVTAQAFAARFRWGDAGLSYDGASATGEVEDYLIARVQTVGGVDGDFNGDNLVTRSDYDVWSTAFGDTVSPGTGADANGNGVVDIGDYTIWRDAFDAAGGAQAAFATSSSAVVDLTGEPLSPERVTALPPKSLATSSFDADAFAPMMLPIPEVAGAIDDSLAVSEDEAVADDALAAALLEWSLDQAEVQDAEDGPSFVDDSDGPSDEEAVATVGEALVL